MSIKQRCSDSTSSTFTNDEIEAIVSRAVEAAVQVLKAEFIEFKDSLHVDLYASSMGQKSMKYKGNIL